MLSWNSTRSYVTPLQVLIQPSWQTFGHFISWTAVFIPLAQIKLHFITNLRIKCFRFIKLLQIYSNVRFQTAFEWKQDLIDGKSFVCGFTDSPLGGLKRGIVQQQFFTPWRRAQREPEGFQAWAVSLLHRSLKGQAANLVSKPWLAIMSIWRTEIKSIQIQKETLYSHS